MARETTDPTNPPLVCTQGTYAGYKYFFGQLLTRVTFMDEYGTDHEMIDTSTDGQPIAPYTQPQCSMNPLTTGTNRGRVFRATDTSDLLFIADSPVIDVVAIGEHGVLLPVKMSGWLLFPDGVKYRVDAGAVSRIVDRNGNQIKFSGGTITDALSRTVTLNNGVISYSGVAAAPRQIVVSYASLGSANTLDSGQNLQNPNQLFPSLTGYVNTSNYTPNVPVSVQFPDGSTYSFRYNSYGELTRLTLPTGGTIAYTYPASVASSANGACESTPYSCVVSGEDAAANLVGYVSRRVLSRNEYGKDGSLQHVTKYSWAFNALVNGASTEATVVDQDGTNNTLRTITHQYYGDSSTNADVPEPPESWYSNFRNGKEILTQTSDANGQLLRQEQQTWTQRPCGSGEPCWFGDPTTSAMSHDPRICQRFTILSDVSPAQTAATLYRYDQYNNTTDTWEFDYGAGPAVSTSCQVPATGSPISGWMRHAQTAYLTSGYDGYDVGTASPDTTTAGTSPYMLSLPTDRQVKDGADNKVSEQSFAYDSSARQPYAALTGHDPARDSSAMHGNATTVSFWLNTSGSFLATTRTFDIAGNVLTAIDPRQLTTTLSYSDCYTSISSCQNSNTYAHPTSIQNAAGYYSYYAYDYSTGHVLQFEDPNKVFTALEYVDALDRLTSVTKASGILNSNTEYFYPNPNTVQTQQDQTATCDGAIGSRVIYDGFGRESERDQFEVLSRSGTGCTLASASQYIAVTTTYDALGRVNSTANPSRITNGQADGLGFLTVYGYDGLGRQKSITASDGAVFTTGYSGNTTTTTDQAGCQRAATADALGRLTKVVEDPASTLSCNGNSSSSHSALATQYTYDPLDDLTSVSQSGRQRLFAYDSLKRLVAANNPENATAQSPAGLTCGALTGYYASCYTYDPDGNLLTKTDNRKAAVSYGYDALNRISGKAYSVPAGVGATPSVAYCYDGAQASGCPSLGSVPYPIGHLSAVLNGNSTTLYTAYDPLGHVKASSQTTALQGYAFSYNYNLAGALTSETYPSGRTIATCYDAVDRPTSVAGAPAGISNPPCTTTPGATQYVSGAIYWPHGALQQFSRANGLWHRDVLQ